MYWPQAAIHYITSSLEDCGSKILASLSHPRVVATFQTSIIIVDCRDPRNVRGGCLPAQSFVLSRQTQ